MLELQSVIWYHNNHLDTVEFLVCVVLLILLVYTFGEVIDEIVPIHQ